MFTADFTEEEGETWLLKGRVKAREAERKTGASGQIQGEPAVRTEESTRSVLRPGAAWAGMGG